MNALTIFGRALCAVTLLVATACAAPVPATTAPTSAPTEPATAVAAAPSATPDQADPTATRPAASPTAPPATSTEAATATAVAATATIAATATTAATLAATAAGLPTPAGPPGTLILATTTSTADSGLLTAILPYFEVRENVDVQVIAVGTGQALAIGARGDADVVLVHARAQEDKFVADGFGIDRRDVMFNDFIIVGPPADPAGILGLTTGREALTRIAQAGAAFASRGDNSGTHTRERALWAAAAITPTSGANGYVALGQGMGETLQFANETGSYTLTDRGTWLARQGGLPNLTVLVGGGTLTENPDGALRNPYGVIAVNPARFPNVNYAKASLFIDWITSLAIQRRIYEFGRDQFGQSLFYPVAHTP